MKRKQMKSKVKYLGIGKVVKKEGALLVFTFYIVNHKTTAVQPKGKN